VAIKILHTADWQLGKAFGKFPDEAAVPLREQRILSVKKIAALAQQHKVDAVLVAGDVFEFETIAEKVLHQTLHAMSAFTGPWLMLPGNHDPGTADSVWTQLRQLDPPSNIVILDKPQAYQFADKDAVVLAAPLQRKHESVDLTGWFDGHATGADTIRIGLAHGSVDNRLPERGEAPNTISDKRAQKADLDYLALGDWHGMLQVDKRCWYSGTHETDRFRDNESGNALLVTIEKHGELPKVEVLPSGHYRWHQVNVSIHGPEGADDLERALQALGDPPDNLVLQVILQGTADLESRARIEKVATKWSGLTRHFELREETLVSRASDDDLEQIGRAGFVFEAVNTLRGMAEDTGNPEAAVADLALQLLYAQHKQMVNKR
jgi:DNA repair exonuclease SbcCD nuclease subunit